MLPDISDGLIIRAIQTYRMVEAGRDYWSRGLVRELNLDERERRATASVKGSAPAPYRVDLIFNGVGPGSRASSRCSCPVGIGCKHAAATLFALRAELNEKHRQVGTTAAPLLMPLAPTKPPAEANASPADLSPELAQWLIATAPLARPPKSAPGADHREIYYLVRPRPVSGKAKAANGKAKTEFDAGRGTPWRLAVEPVQVTLRANGNPVVSPQWAWRPELYGPDRGSAHITPEDRLLIRRLQLRIGEVDGSGALDGTAGLELLRRIIATGRGRWGSVKGPAMEWGVAIGGRFEWQTDIDARIRLTLAIEAAPSVIVAALAPPLAIDTKSGLLMSVETGVEPLLAEQLLRLPPVPPQSVQMLAARWGEVAPELVPAPVLPKIRELGMLAPTPVLTLLVDKVSMEELYHGFYRSSRKTRSEWALARLTFDYGAVEVDSASVGETLMVRDGDDLMRFTRDLSAEARASDRLLIAGLHPLGELEAVYPTDRQDWDFATTLRAGPADFAPFLVGDAERLRSEGWRVELAPDFPLELATLDADSLAFEIEAAGIDWFDLSLGAVVDGQRIDLVPALRSLLAALGPVEIDQLLQDEALLDPGATLPVMLEGGRVASLPLARIAPVLKALLLLAGSDGLPAGGGRLAIARTDLGMLAALEQTTPGFAWRGAEPLRALARRLATMRFEPVPPPPDFTATLRPYQQTGLDWLQALDGAGFGGLLADDMGLGKTVQTLAHIASLNALGRLNQGVLIVAPTSVLPNWLAEIENFVPHLSTLLLHGPDRRAQMDSIAEHDIVLTSYPLLVRDKDLLARTTFGLIVYDEAHNLKNPRTASHAAARLLSAERRIALTGTPVENRLTDAWALIDLVVPGLLGSLSEFGRTYRTPIEKHGDKQAKVRLARRLKPFLLRRTKEGVATDLPEKSLIPELIELGSEQMALHESQRLLMHQRVREEIARVGFMRAQIMVLSALTRLRQICCDPRLIGTYGTTPPASAKLERLLEMLDELIPEGRRIILFSQFTSMLDLIKLELDRRAISWVELTGKSKDRKTPVVRFQAGEVPLILVSLKAGGTGLNLTAADTILLFDPWWNPAIEAQAIDRAHRIGQTKPVFVHRLIAKGTIEEKILALQARKAAIAETLWSEDSSAVAQLSEEDIAFLLG